MKLAVIGAAHWHVPLYEPGFTKAEAQVAAVWDADGDAAAGLARRHGARIYDSLDALLKSGIDLAFVFGSPAAMPALAKAVMLHGIPLSLEKPCARTAAEVAAIKGAAEARGLYASVPLVQRFAVLGRELTALAAGDPAIDLSFRFIAGPPERYDRAGCGWALDPAVSGGGPIINLAVHFIDLALLLTGSPARSVFARTSDLMHGRAVEDRGLLSIRHDNGALTTIEVGYRFPDALPLREFRLSLIGRRHYVESLPDALIVRSAAGPAKTIPVNFDTDVYYTDYVVRVIEDVRGRQRPLVGLGEMQAALAVVDAAYASASSGRSVCLGAAE